MSSPAPEGRGPGGPAPEGRGPGGPAPEGREPSSPAPEGRGPSGVAILGILGALTLVFAVIVVPHAFASVDVPPDLPGPTTPPTEEAAPTTAPVTCTNPAASRRPDATVATGSYMDTVIRPRGRLRVGVDVSKQLFTSFNPLTKQFEGFDIEIAKQVAASLFGDPNAIEYVAIPTSERLNVLTGQNTVVDPVDMVADTFTMTCARTTEIDFSTEYFTAGQRLLVRDDDPTTSLAEMGPDRKVCAAAGSTSVDNILALPNHPEVVQVTQQADCLVLMQQGEVDAVSTDDTILAGMVAQDPNLRVVGPRISSEPYGIGLPKGHPEWVRYVNSVLDDMRTSGRWDQLYNAFLSEPLGPSTGPPPPVYSD
jgi:polar amino acid transport system substrate-binding protein